MNHSTILEDGDEISLRSRNCLSNWERSTKYFGQEFVMRKILHARGIFMVNAYLKDHTSCYSCHLVSSKSEVGQYHLLSIHSTGSEY